MGSLFLRDLATTWPPNTPTHQELLGAADSLDGLHAENKAFRSALQEAGAIESALRAEVERLREECEFWRGHLHLDSLKMDGQHTWRLMWNHFPLVGSDAGEAVRNALEAIRTQPLPAPPAKEE